MAAAQRPAPPSPRRRHPPASGAARSPTGKHAAGRPAPAPLSGSAPPRRPAPGHPRGPAPPLPASSGGQRNAPHKAAASPPAPSSGAAPPPLVPLTGRAAPLRRRLWLLRGRLRRPRASARPRAARRRRQRGLAARTRRRAPPRGAAGPAPRSAPAAEGRPSAAPAGGRAVRGSESDLLVVERCRRSLRLTMPLVCLVKCRARARLLYWCAETAAELRGRRAGRPHGSRGEPLGRAWSTAG